MTPLTPVYAIVIGGLLMVFAIRPARAWLWQTGRDAIKRAGDDVRGEVVKWAGIAAVGIVGTLTAGEVALNLAPQFLRSTESPSVPRLVPLDSLGLDLVPSRPGGIGPALAGAASAGGGGGGASLVRGAGVNIPDAGVGWTHAFELDVTQSDQSALKAALGYAGTLGTPDAEWSTPDVNGSGAYFDEAVGGYRSMRFTWGVNDSGEGRAALHPVTLGGYTSLYVRALVNFTTAQAWPSGTVKLIGWGPGLNPGPGTNFFNVYDNVAATPPWQYAYTNIALDPSGPEVRTTSTTLAPSAFDTWAELELVITRNSTTSLFDGVGALYVDGAAITFDSGFNAIKFSDVNVAISSFSVGPYLGGSPPATVTTEFSIRFANLSVWGK